jgi:DNA-binding NtrC family response regulator
MIERLALTVGRKRIVSGEDVRFDLELYSLPSPTCLQEVESPVTDQLKEIIISRRFKGLTDKQPTMAQSEGQELEMYLEQIAKVGGNLAEAARQLRIKRTTLHMRIKRLQRGEGYL